MTLRRARESYPDDELFIWRSAGISQCGRGAGQFKRPLSPELWLGADRVVLAADIGSSSIYMDYSQYENSNVTDWVGGVGMLPPHSSGL